jgi:hypothetical protein
MREAGPCALCHRPIDWDVPHWYDGLDGRRHVHPASPVLDERVPLRDGGCPWDGNAQAAHAACNAAKGAHSQEWCDGPGHASIMAALPTALARMHGGVDWHDDVETGREW